jgi:hypothetical protein
MPTVNIDNVIRQLSGNLLRPGAKMNRQSHGNCPKLVKVMPKSAPL